MKKKIEVFYSGTIWEATLETPFTWYPDNFKSIEETRMGLAQLSTSGHQF